MTKPSDGRAGDRGTRFGEMAQEVCVCVHVRVYSSSCLLWALGTHVGSGIIDQKGMVTFNSEQRLEAG